MKGLEVSKAFFFEWGLPAIQSSFPNLAERIAAGKFAGSDVIGADDDLSIDHSWGPTFTVFLPDDDYAREGTAFEQKINRLAPANFKGYSLKGGLDRAVSIVSIHGFFENIFQCVPKTPREWVSSVHELAAIETYLYFLKHGGFYYDALGEFSALREHFSTYPPDLFNLRMALCAYQVAHYGEYNFCWRLIHRQDPLTIQMGLAFFSKAVMEMCFLIDGDFTPYWKWLPFVFRRLAIAGELAPKLEILAGGYDLKTKKALVLDVCGLLKRELVTRGLVPVELPNPYGIPWFFLYQEVFKNKIEDTKIKKMIW